ncbi:MAG: serine hydrolase domain-containing protein [Jhaorihella sp.]
MTGLLVQRFRSELIDEWIDGERKEGRLATGALLISIDGHLRYSRAFGRHGGATGAPVTADSRFWIASMTKPITSFAAMMLASRGLLHLAAPVADFIADFGSRGVLGSDGVTVRPDRAVTVLDLMRHTAGVTYGKFGDQTIHRLYQAADVVDYGAPNTVISARIARLPLMNHPGAAFEYGMSTDLLGTIVERISGYPLARVLDDLIFIPLGMRATGFRPSPEQVVQLPGSDVQRALAPPLDRGIVWESGGAGLFSTASDYMKFALMMLGKGALGNERLLAASVFSRMLLPQLPANVTFGAYTHSLGPAAPWPRNGLSFGLGLAVRTRPEPTLPGGIGEFFWPGASGANFWCDPAASMAVVFLNHDSEDRVRHRINLRRAVYAAIR